MTAPSTTWANEAFCYVTTTGRRSGSDHTIEIWFAADDGALYLISGGGETSDWVQNLLADPRCGVRIGDTHLRSAARLPLAHGVERDLAVALLHGKYRDQVSGSLAAWKRDAYLVALDPSEENP